MFQRSIKKVRKSIFPIFFEKIDGTTKTVGVLGTGFFIHKDGHFITAYHVIQEVPDKSKLIYWGNIPNSGVPAPQLIQEIFSDPKRDIFIGKVDNYGLPPLPFSKSIPRVGTSICLCGYPLSELSFLPNGVLEVGRVRQYWQPTYIIDNIHIDKDGKKFDCFLTQNVALPGMSGGPVFNRKGFVIGISLMMYPREIKLPNRNPIEVQNGIAIGSNYIEDILSKYASSIRKFRF